VTSRECGTCHFACACREAMLARDIAELRAEVERLRTAIRVGGAMLRAEVAALGGPVEVKP
jgi:hypothetical protein